MSSQTLNYFEPQLKRAIDQIVEGLRHTYHISKRSVALLFLQKDPEIEALIQKKEGTSLEKLKALRQSIAEKEPQTMSYAITMNRQKKVDDIVSRFVQTKPLSAKNISAFLDRLLIHPVLGYGVLAVILYYAIYKFVGVFAAGDVVDFIESGIFEAHINPWITNVVTSIIPWQLLSDLFVGEYGLITLGIRYAVALILPIVAAFFLAFSIIEDSGYLPRLSLLLDRTFKKIGLNGRAVIPMVLGLGCDTMATMVTRVLETKRERVISTLLLSLAIPCSAQLGLILAILAPYPNALMLWGGILVLEFLFIGYLASKILPGTNPNFYMELPPLRVPKLSNVLSKTTARVTWYFKEVFPLFLLASVFIWIGMITGIFQWMVKGLEPLMAVIGLPAEMAVITLFGFFRRDYGAAGLFDLQSEGLMTGNQIAVAAITLTLFLPCIAQFLIMKKERGLKVTLTMCAFIFCLAMGTGYLVHTLLTITGIQL